MKSYSTGYCQSDFQNNRSLWQGVISSASEDSILLLKMGYLRAQHSRVEFKPVTMNRRGTIALGIGFVNEIRTQINFLSASLAVSELN